MARLNGLLSKGLHDFLPASNFIWRYFFLKKLAFFLNGSHHNNFGMQINLCGFLFEI